MRLLIYALSVDIFYSASDVIILTTPLKKKRISDVIDLCAPCVTWFSDGISLCGCLCVRMGDEDRSLPLYLHY